MNVWFFFILLIIVNPAFASIADLKALITQQNYLKAIELGQKLKQHNPDSVSVLFYTALAYQYNKQPEQAKKLYLKAIEQNTRLPEIYNNLATIYALEKNYTKAADTLTLAINSNKSIATAYANLSNIYRYMASQAYQQVLADGTSKKKHHSTPLHTQLLTSLHWQEDINRAKPVIKTVTAKESSAKVVAIKNNTKNINKSVPSVQQAIIDWADAWQTKRFDDYIKSYTDTYAPKNLTHTQWVAQRKQRINRPGDIFVDVRHFDIQQNGQQAIAHFNQAYRSKTYRDKVRKRMHLRLINGRWLITSEVTLSVL